MNCNQANAQTSEASSEARFFNRIVWGDNAGLHSATLSGDYGAAITLANSLHSAGAAPFGLVILELSSRTQYVSRVQAIYEGVRGGLSAADIESFHLQA